MIIRLFKIALYLIYFLFKMIEKNLDKSLLLFYKRHGIPLESEMIVSK
jgi:hypothetical protein